MAYKLLVVGEGMLADFVCKQLSLLTCEVRRQKDFVAFTQTEEKRQVIRSEGEWPDIQADLALVLHDTWQPHAYLAAEEVLPARGIPWLRSFFAFGEGVVGPLVLPGTPGCSRCADMRQLMGGRDRQEMWRLQQQVGKQTEAACKDPWASRTGVVQLARLVCAEVERLQRGLTPRTESHVYLLQLNTLKSSLHFFLPDPTCPVCGNLPEDTAPAAHITLKTAPKLGSNSFRCRSMDELKQVLAKDYLGTRTGFLSRKMRDLVSPFADVSVTLPLFSGDEGTAGRTHSYADSEQTAILEGLERYCGLAPRGKRTIVYDSYRNVAKSALNPVAVGLHTKEQYDRPKFPFKPFDPDRQLNWVWGYSFLQERPILVPESLAYYHVNGYGFTYETSNGCALGGSLEEAIFYGILEVVERDSFLLTWYARLPLPRLDPASANDCELDLMLERLRVVGGYDLYFYNATMENGIPSVWTLAKSRKQAGMNLICAGGAHPDPIRAVKSSLHEVAAMTLTLDDKCEASREEYLRMLEDPYLVVKMEDHSMLYGLPEAEDRLHFLLAEDRPLRTFAEEYPPMPSHVDLRDDLQELLQAFRRLEVDVIVVDQTTPEIGRNGLHCVKVLIPGMLPMTFGYHLTRLEGLSRVLTVPAELGYVRQPLTYDQLNPHPHPFP